jgi:phosphoglycolate phosphatase
MAQKALLFDLDGTLWDSHPLYAEALSRTSGVPASEILRRLKQPDTNVVRLADELRVSRAAFVQECRRMIALLRLYPGVRRTLGKLRATPLALVTNLPASLVMPIMEESGISEFFPVVECNAKKPGAAGLIRALAALRGPTRQSSYYVGDAPRDAGAARTAGIRFAWASYGYGDRVANADVVLARFAEVLRL